jgi:nicotinate phosphoribosyltransferase
LDAADFPDASIVLSNNLDEMVIWQIITQIVEEAPRYGLDADATIKRLVFGVGTRLITSWGEPALGGVYKLVAVEERGEWIPAIKLSETPAKTPNPGSKRVWRIYDQRGNASADLLSLSDESPGDMDEIALHHPSDHTKSRTLMRNDISGIEPLLVDVLHEGELVYSFPPLDEIRDSRRADVARLDPGVRRIMNPHIYHVSLSQQLWELKQKLIFDATQGYSSSVEIINPKSLA